MFGFFFRAEPVRSFTDARTADAELFRRFFHAALSRGVYLAPALYEAGFVSSAHTDDPRGTVVEYSPHEQRDVAVVWVLGLDESSD